MINIKESVHTGTTIVSLNKALKLAEVYGKIEIDDLYLLNTIYALLNTMCLSLTNNQRKKLISVYNKLAFKSKEVCTDIMLKAFQQPMQNKFTQSFVDPDCITKNTNINYWKTEMFDTFDDVFDNLSKDDLNDKPFKSKVDFENETTVSASGIGKFAFFLNTTNNTNITIFDALNNDVTHAFTIGYVSTLNGILIVSNLIYTSTPMNLKIITNA